jgi:nitrogen fixation NifU-like protein
MSDLGDLYQQLILDHNRHPRNFQQPAAANRHAEGYNPLCGDRFSVYLQVEDGVLRDVGFQGMGCAISKASASLLTASVKGKPLAEAGRLFASFHHLVSDGEAPADPVELGKLSVFAGVRAFPVRVKCASLAWHTLQAALDTKDGVVSTE